jgi:hypothetical protein
MYRGVVTEVIMALAAAAFGNSALSKATANSGEATRADRFSVFIWVFLSIG